MAAIGRALRQSPCLTSLLRPSLRTLPYSSSSLPSPLRSSLSAPLPSTSTNTNITTNAIHTSSHNAHRHPHTTMLPLCDPSRAVWKRALSSIFSSSLETEGKPLHQIELQRSLPSLFSSFGLLIFLIKIYIYIRLFGYSFFFFFL